MSLLDKALKKYAHHDLQPNDDEPREIVGDEWGGISSDPKQLEALRYTAQVVRQIRAGVRPEYWTANTECKHCGPVLIWEGCPPKLQGCPWCFNRIKGLPIPRMVK